MRWLLLVLLSTSFFFPRGAMAKDGSETPVEVIRAYYAALNRHDVRAARTYWRTPPSRLQQMMQQATWYRLEEATEGTQEGAAASVNVRVAVKLMRADVEYWGGLIRLEQQPDGWRIAQMQVTKRAPPVLPPLPVAPTRSVPQASSPSWSAGGVSPAPFPAVPPTFTPSRLPTSAWSAPSLLEELVFPLFLFLAGGALYCLPWIIARARHHHNGGAIVVLNLLLGWTFVGWVIALVWASTQVKRPE